MSGVPCITLLTDFGTADGYAGAMKGVIVSLCPEARIVDLTHEIAAGDVRAGAFALSTAAPLFPGGTIHVAVVDPGVGTERRALLVEAGGAFFVGPDNGLLSLAAAEPRRIWVLDRDEWFRQPTSATFHGRDVFAPIAARLAGGTAAAKLGTRADAMTEIRVVPATRNGAAASGEVIHVDRFGNVITNLRVCDFPAGSGVVVDAGEFRGIPVRETYGHCAAGMLLALVGSSGFVEIAVSSGSARDVLGDAAQIGAPVRLRTDD